LDLRLFGETGNYPIQDVSGFKVLDIILSSSRKRCPVLITSASNKIWSYKEAISRGADAYWVKQGLDDYSDTESIVEIIFIL